MTTQTMWSNIQKVRDGLEKMEIGLFRTVYVGISRLSVSSHKNIEQNRRMLQESRGVQFIRLCHHNQSR